MRNQSRKTHNQSHYCKLWRVSLTWMRGSVTERERENVCVCVCVVHACVGAGMCVCVYRCCRCIYMYADVSVCAGAVHTCIWVGMCLRVSACKCVRVCGCACVREEKSIPVCGHFFNTSQTKSNLCSVCCSLIFYHQQDCYTVLCEFPCGYRDDTAILSLPYLQPYR